MWLLGMKVRDEKGRPVGLLAFQLFGVRFLIVNIKSPACSGFLCDDMGLGKTIQGLAVGQILHNYSQLSYLLMEAIPHPTEHEPTSAASRISVVSNGP
jgi:SNF2 family DNA or RNA helicase